MNTPGYNRQTSASGESSCPEGTSSSPPGPRLLEGTKTAAEAAAGPIRDPVDCGCCWSTRVERRCRWRDSSSCGGTWSACCRTGERPSQSPTGPGGTWSGSMPSSPTFQPPGWPNEFAHDGRAATWCCPTATASAWTKPPGDPPGSTPCCRAPGCAGSLRWCCAAAQARRAA